MQKHTLHPSSELYHFIITFLFCFLLPIFGVKAQLIPDNTLGSENSVVTNTDTQRDLIEKGAIRGSNLFHSFTEFNVGELREVYFNPNVDITNILTRVTGNNSSNILGTLGVLGNANLFLINPHGIYFGENAKLDISGSFTASTADGIMLGDDAFFSATDPEHSTLLNIAQGVLFTNALRDYQSSIKNEGILTVGQDLILDGDQLIITGKIGAGNDLILQGNDSVTIRDSVENPFIAVANNNLTIRGNNLIDIFALNHEDSGLYSGNNLTLISDNTAIGDAHFNSGGSFKIEDLTGNLGNLSSPNDPIIRSYGDVSFDFYWGSSLHIIAGGSVNINTAWIDYPETEDIQVGGEGIDFIKEDVTLSDGETIINIDGSSRPTLDIRAGVLPEYVGENGVTGVDYSADWFYYDDQPEPQPTDEPTSANITIGDIYTNISAPNVQVFLTNNYYPNPNLQGNINLTPPIGRWGDGIDIYNGEVIIDSRRDININGTIDTYGGKQSGNVSFYSGRNINLNSGSLIDTSSSQQAGNILFDSDGNINLNQDAKIKTRSSQNAGNILFNSEGNINLNQGSLIDTYGGLQAGNVSFYSGGDINLNQGSLIDTSSSNQAGNIFFNSGENMNFQEGSLIDIFGLVNAGNLTFYSDSDINLNGTINTSFLGYYYPQNGASILFDSGGNINLNQDSLINTVGFQQTGDVTFYSGGDINLNTAIIAQSLQNSGNILFDSEGNINLNQASSIDTFSYQEAGDISLFGNNINLNLARINATGLIGGTINFDADQEILVQGSSITNANKGNTDNLDINNLQGGNINFDSQRLIITNNSLIGNNTYNKINAGGININTDELLRIEGENTNLQSVSQGEGNAGNILIKTGDFYLEGMIFNDSLSSGDGATINITVDSLTINSGYLASGTTEKETVGHIIINANNNISLLNHGFVTTIPNNWLYPDSNSNAGNIDIITNNLTLNNSIILAQSNGISNSGNININATGTMLVENNSHINNSLAPNGIGTSGNIDINTASLFINNSSIANTIYGKGNANKIEINASNSINLDQGHIDSIVFKDALGNGGDILITTPNLELLNNSEILSSLYGIGKAGNIVINVNNAVNLSNFSSIDNSVLTGGVGNGGFININSNNLNLTEGSQISSGVGQETILFDQLFPGGIGNGGDIVLNINDSINISGVANYNNGGYSSGIIAGTSIGSQGLAGNITINTNNFKIFDGAVVDSSTNNTFNGGNITINANNFTAETGGQIITSTFNSGNAGNIKLNIADTILIDGIDPTFEYRLATFGEDNISNVGAFSGIFANTLPGSTGNGGTINIDPINTIIRNYAGIGVNSQGTGIGGDIFITSDNLRLENNAFISAETFSNNGGNIYLNIPQLLTMKNNSSITTTAGLGSGEGDGGNININAGFIIAFPNQMNQIIANAFEGKGGNINITTNAIFGSPRYLNISASSEFGLDGTVVINTPAVDPTSGLINLPQNTVTPTVVNQCQPGQTNSFVIVGKGGIPSIPTDLFPDVNIWEDWQNINNLPEINPSVSQNVKESFVNSNNSEIIHAQGLGINEKGEVMITEYAVNLTPQPPNFRLITCGE